MITDCMKIWLRDEIYINVLIDDDAKDDEVTTIFRDRTQTNKLEHMLSAMMVIHKGDPIDTKFLFAKANQDTFNRLSEVFKKMAGDGSD